MNASRPPVGLACVGLGMTLGSHIAPLARNHIEQADVVFVAASDGVVEQWVLEMNPDVRSLQDLYAPGRSRMDTYRTMIDTVLSPLRQGKSVCAAFYGHPGVFSWPAHRAIDAARREGFTAVMVPGISAEDCLYADLGIDPGLVGCQHFETTQFMVHRRQVDAAAWLILWQAGVAGDLSLVRQSTSAEYLQVLVQLLGAHYPPDHPVIVYRAVTVAIHPPRIETMRLDELPQAEIGAQDTLALRPARTLEPNREVRAQIAAIDERILAVSGQLEDDVTG